MHYSFDGFCASKQLVDLKDHSGVVEEIQGALDLGSVHSEEIVCYYAEPGRPAAFMEVIRAPGRDEPSYHLRRGVWDEIAIGDDELRRLEKILYECLESESF